jgi:hypothetical protein
MSVNVSVEMAPEELIIQLIRQVGVSEYLALNQYVLLQLSTEISDPLIREALENVVRERDVSYGEVDLVAIDRYLLSNQGVTEYPNQLIF